MPTLPLRALLLMAITLPCTASYADQNASFDIQGMTVGMSNEALQETASALLDSPEAMEDMPVYFMTPQRQPVETSIHNTGYKFNAAHSKYTISLARKPMGEQVKKIVRRVEYRQLSDSPGYEAYRDALINKYGEPISVKKSVQSTFISDRLLFTNREPGPGCPDVEAGSTLKVQAYETDGLKDCGKLLQVELLVLNQPPLPVKRVTFEMIDPYLIQKDEEGYMAYWNEWMDDYLNSLGTSDSEPVL